MAKLSAAEQKLLAKLTAKAKAPDAEDYEVRIKDGEKEVSIPASRAGSWVEQHFGIKLFDSDEEEAGDEGDEEEAGDEGDEGEGEPSRSYFRGKRGKQ
jgi:hypothetical protein